MPENQEYRHIWFIMINLEREIQEFRNKLANTEDPATLETLLTEFQALERAYLEMRTWLLEPLN